MPQAKRKENREVYRKENIDLSCACRTKKLAPSKVNDRVYLVFLRKGRFESEPLSDFKVMN